MVQPYPFFSRWYILSSIVNSISINLYCTGYTNQVGQKRLAFCNICIYITFFLYSLHINCFQSVWSYKDSLSVTGFNWIWLQSRYNLHSEPKLCYSIWSLWTEISIINFHFLLWTPGYWAPRYDFSVWGIVNNVI